jgi:hypothetical protein
MPMVPTPAAAIENHRDPSPPALTNTRESSSFRPVPPISQDDVAA